MSFAKLPQEATATLATLRSHYAVLMYAAVSYATTMGPMTIAELDAWASVPARAGRRARTMLEGAGLIEKVGSQWQLTGHEPPQNRTPMSGDTKLNRTPVSAKPDAHVRSDRTPVSGAPYIEKIENRADQSWHEGSAPLPRQKPRKWNDTPEDDRRRVGKMMARIKGAMREHGNHRMSFDDTLRWALLEHGNDALVEDITRRIAAGDVDGADHPFAVIASRLEQWALELPEAAPVVSLTDRRNKQTTRDAKRIRHALARVPSDAPDEDAFRMVHAEAREEITRYSLKTLADVHAWLDSHQEVSHAA